MKLFTMIQPRRDGTVRVANKSGEVFVFTKGATGDLECDVADRAFAEQLLMSSDNYWTDDPDFVPTAQTQDDGEVDIDPDDPDGNLGVDDDDEMPNDGMPIESSTPPVPGRAGKSKKK